MAQALAHFAVGTACTTLLLAYLAPSVPYHRLLAGLGGVWALLPDLYRLVPASGGPVEWLHGSALTNLFWFHHALDRLNSVVVVELFGRRYSLEAISYKYPGNWRFVWLALSVLVVATYLADRRRASDPESRLLDDPS